MSERPAEASVERGSATMIALDEVAPGESNRAHFENALSVAAYTREIGLRPIEAELIADYFAPPPARVLDLGCGAGRTTVGLFQRGYRTVGVDLSAALIAEGSRLHPTLDLRQMDATDLLLPDASFDCALFSYNGIDGIYPLAQRRRAMAETLRVLRPGGAFVFSSHNFLGSVWSGGYFYPRGYLNAARFLIEQRGNPFLREGFFRYPDPAGDQFLYSAPPSRTVGQLRDAGFEVLAVVGYRREMKRGAVARRSQHVHFVARKPGGQR